MFDEPLSKLRRLSIPGSLFTYGACENIVRLGSLVFPSLHAWQVYALTPHSPLCFDKFTIAAAQNPRKKTVGGEPLFPAYPPQPSNGISPVHD